MSFGSATRGGHLARTCNRDPVVPSPSLSSSLPCCIPPLNPPLSHTLARANHVQGQPTHMATLALLHSITPSLPLLTCVLAMKHLGACPHSSTHSALLPHASSCCSPHPAPRFQPSKLFLTESTDGARVYSGSDEGGNSTMLVPGGLCRFAYFTNDVSAALAAL
jgi:hypothetical protein